MNARRYWAGVLAAAVAVSVAGNVGHALLTAHAALRVPAAVAAALPPLALLAVTEGLARSHGRGVRRRVYRAGVAGGVAIAGLAFALSFAALRDLAIALGQPAAVAAGWPLLADATIAVSSIMVLALRPDTEAATATAADTVAACVPATVTKPATDAATDRVPATRKPATATRPATRKPKPATRRATKKPTATRNPGARAGAVAGAVDGPDAERFMGLSQQLVAEGRVRAPVVTVAAALAGIASGASQRSVSAATGLHRTVVAKVAAAAAETEGGRRCVRGAASACRGRAPTASGVAATLSWSGGGGPRRRVAFFELERRAKSGRGASLHFDELLCGTRAFATRNLVRCFGKCVLYSVGTTHDYAVRRQSDDDRDHRRTRRDPDDRRRCG